MNKEISKKETNVLNTNQDLEDIFLDNFKELEAYLVAHCNLNDDYVSFSRALTKIHNDDLDPVIEQEENYEFLKSASDLRNIMSHRNNVCKPTKEFLDKFLKMKQRIITPTRCIDIATKNIISINFSTSISNTIKLMNQHKISHIPVLENGIVKGIFSKATLFDIYIDRGSIKMDDTYIVSDIREYTYIQNHTTETYIFSDPNSTIVDVFRRIRKKIKHEKKVAMILLTENGNPKERLLGVLTETDIILNGINK